MSRELATDPVALGSAVVNAAASTAGAWAGGPAAVEGFLRWVVADLNRLPSLVIEHAEFRHYGSGYASYVDVFISKRDGSMRRSMDGTTEVEGLTLALCRLAPLAALFKHSWRSSGPGPAGGHSMPELSRMVDDDPPGWEQECRQIRRTLDEHGIALLDSRILGLPLNVRLQVETALGEPPYRVFDAWFHWTDQPHHFPA